MINKTFKITIQIAIIYIIYMAGNLISNFIVDFIVIPGNIIGMVILLVLLTSNVLKLAMIEETGNFMLKYMGFSLLSFLRNSWIFCNIHPSILWCWLKHLPFHIIPSLLQFSLFY